MNRLDKLMILWGYLAKLDMAQLKKLRIDMLEIPGGTLRHEGHHYAVGDVIAACDHYIEERMSEQQAREFFDELYGLGASTRAGRSRKKQAL